MSLDDRMRNLFPFHSFLLLREFFFYFFECHFERMPA